MCNHQIGIQRQARLLIRNKQFIRAHVMQDIVMGLIVGTLFWNTPHKSFQVRCGNTAALNCVVSWIQQCQPLTVCGVHRVVLLVDDVFGVWWYGGSAHRSTSTHCGVETTSRKDVWISIFCVVKCDRVHSTGCNGHTHIWITGVLVSVDHDALN